MQEIGRVIGTEKRPNTAYTFYFWTPPGQQVGIGSLVKVAAESETVYGTVVEAHGFNDLESPLHEFLAVGGRAEHEPPTLRPEMRVFQAAVLRREPPEPVGAVPIGRVFLADERDVQVALRTDDYVQEHGIPCGCYGPKERPIAVHLHSHFLLGPEAGHLNMTGTSGLAAKTSYILFLLKTIFESCRGGGAGVGDKGVAALLFNTKGGDLLYIDKEPPQGYLEEVDHALYRACGLDPAPFPNVRYYAPITKGGGGLNTLRNNAACCEGNPTARFSFGLREVIKHVEVLLNRDDLDAKADAYLQYLNDKFVEASDGSPIHDGGPVRRARTLAELVEIIRDQLRWCEANNASQIQSHNALTVRKMYNRIGNLGQRFAGVIAEDGEPEGPLAEGPFEPNTVYVVDVAQLSLEEQDLVFAAFITGLRERMENQSLGVDRLIVVVDELNKYAPSGGRDTYVARSLREIAARGRYLGLTLFGAQQFKSRVDKEVVGNAATHAFGHIEAEELAQPGYGYFTPAVKEKLGALEQGEILIKHPHFAQPIFVRFPRPACLKGSDGMRMYPRESGRSMRDLLFEHVKRVGMEANRGRDLIDALSPADDNLLRVLRAARKAESPAELERALRSGKRLPLVDSRDGEPVLADPDADPFR